MADDNKINHLENDDLEKGAIKNAIVAGAMVLAGSHEGKVSAMTPPPRPAPIELNDNLKHISMIESSGGKNKNHAKTNVGVNKGDTAAGATGLMPITARETLKHNPELGKKYSHLHNLSDDQVTEALNKNPSMEADISNHHWKRLDSIFGKDNPRKAYAWRNGIHAAQSASKDVIMKHPYVQKYLKESAKRSIASVKKSLTLSHGGLGGPVGAVGGAALASESVEGTSIKNRVKKKLKDIELLESKESGLAKAIAELEDAESLFKMSQPKIGFPHFDKLSTRPDQEVQLMETGRQKEIFGRKVANKELKDKLVGDRPGSSGEKRIVSMQPNRDSEAKRIAGRFGRNALGSNINTKHGPVSGALAGKARSKFEAGDEEHAQKITEHNEKRNAVIKDYNNKMNDWRKKGNELLVDADKSPEHAKTYMDHRVTRPEKPILPRKPAKKAIATKDLSPEKVKDRGNSVDSTIHHEALHHTMAEMGNKYGQKAVKQTTNAMINNIHPETVEKLGSFIEKRGYKRSSPKFHEEILAHSRDILNNKDKREAFKSHVGNDADIHMSRLKSAHKRNYQYAQNLKPEDIEKSDLKKAKEDLVVSPDKRKEFRAKKKKVDAPDFLSRETTSAKGVSDQGIEARRGDAKKPGVISHGYARVADPKMHMERAKKIASEIHEKLKAMPKANLPKKA